MLLFCFAFLTSLQSVWGVSSQTGHRTCTPPHPHAVETWSKDQTLNSCIGKWILSLLSHQESPWDRLYVCVCVSCSVVSDCLWPHGMDPLSMEFSRQKYWSGLPFHSLGDLPYPSIEPGSPALQADSLPSEPPSLNWQAGSVHLLGLWRWDT